ncbi:hypothetical protein B0H13DRAFT_1853974 [Mycena leptocephala]|nr:hypothetical protein B0H13DRAFT_1853974 [Mycena leptocephala]
MSAFQSIAFDLEEGHEFLEGADGGEIKDKIEIQGGMRMLKCDFSTLTCPYLLPRIGGPTVRRAPGTGTAASPNGCCHDSEAPGNGDSGKDAGPPHSSTLLIRWWAHDGGTVPKTPLKTRQHQQKKLEGGGAFGDIIVMAVLHSHEALLRPSQANIQPQAWVYTNAALLYLFVKIFFLLPFCLPGVKAPSAESSELSTFL